MRAYSGTSLDFEFLTYDSKQQLPAAASAIEGGISVQREAYWSYCGSVLSTDPDDFPASLYEWQTATLSGSILPILSPLLNFVNDFISERGLDNYWITLRATTATYEYDKTRWHTDDMFFSAGSGGLLSRVSATNKRHLDLQTDWKICATLLGPSTLFIPSRYQPHARKIQFAAKKKNSKDHPCTSIRCAGCATAADAVRDDLAANLSVFGSEQAKKGECAVFRIGQESGAVHSEPQMSCGGRIFVNIVPGKREELCSLVSKWGMDFPRSWWISPSVSHLSTKP
ncbi:hypothetical protein TruAng_008593 [Truncatella angustata]|nr:hypothetical protein TruAng_008593 [Truncatella angustata]